MKIQLSDHFTYNRLLRFTFPSIIMAVFTSLYGVVDGFFVANYAGKTALAAVNFVFPVLIILATFGYMFGTGGSALVAKTLGEGRQEKAQKQFTFFVFVTGALSVVFGLGGWLFLPPLMRSLGAEGEMLNQAVLYGRILLPVLPFWNLQFLFQIFFVTAEKPKLGLYITLIAGFTNMILDALFVAVFDWGLVGAAVATAVSQVVGGAIPIVYFLSKNSSLLRLVKTKFDRKAFLRAASNGSSEFVTSISGSLVNILYNTQLIAYAGENGVAAYGIMMYVSMIFHGIFVGYANGAAPVSGFNYGARNRPELKNVFRKSVTIIVISSIAMLVSSELLSVPFAKIFAGYDGALFDMTLHGFRLYSISFLFCGMAIYGSAFFTSLNNGLVSASISFARTLFFQIICVMFLPKLLGVDGIWMSIVIAECMAVVVAVVFLVINRKKYQY